MTYKIPEGWVKVELGEVTEYIARGITPKYTEENGIKVVNQRCIRDYKIDSSLFRLHNLDKRKITEEKYLRNKDILINSTGVGTLGRLAQVEEVLEPITVDSHVTIVRGNDRVDKKFLNYSLVNKKKNIESLAQGSTGQTELSGKRLSEEIEFNLAPINEQKVIADTLSALDDKIELNIKINENLEKQAQAIFKHWFIDFEFPDENGNPYKSSGGEMVESELGMIPKGWEVVELGDIISICNGKRPKVKVDTSDKENRYPILGASGIMGYTNDFIYNEPILVIGRVGTHGVVQKVNNKAWTSDNTMVIKSNYYEFTNQVLLSLDYKSLNRGSTQPLLAQRDIKNQKIVIPSKNKEMLDLYESTFNEYRKQINTFKQQNQNFSQFRDTLLPELMSGELRIPLD